MTPTQPGPLKPTETDPVRKHLALVRTNSAEEHCKMPARTESGRAQLSHTHSAAASPPAGADPGPLPAEPRYSPGAARLTQGRPAPPYTRRRLGTRSAPPAAAFSPAALTTFSSSPLPQPLGRPVRRRGCRRHHPTGVPRCRVRCAVCAGPSGQPPGFGFHGQLAALGRAAGGTRLPAQTLWECQRRDTRREPAGLPAVPLRGHMDSPRSYAEFCRPLSSLLCACGAALVD